MGVMHVQARGLKTWHLASFNGGRRLIGNESLCEREHAPWSETEETKARLPRQPVCRACLEVASSGARL